MSDRPADRSWAGPVVGVLVLVLGVVTFVALGGHFTSGPGTPTTSPVACACEPPPPSNTPDFVRAEAHVAEPSDGTVTVEFAENRDAAALLVVVGPNASVLPAGATSWTNGTPAVTATDARNATFADGSVTVEEARGGVLVTDRGLLLPREGASVDLAVPADAYVGVLALPPADGDREASVLAEWTGGG